MEIRPDEDVDENILPRVIKVEETTCLLCKRRRRFLCCQKCAEEEDCLVYLEQEFVGRLENFKHFPGVLSGLTKLQVRKLQEERSELKECEQRTEKVLRRLHKKNDLATKIISARNRINALRQMHQLQLQEIERIHKEKNVVQSNIEQLQRRTERVLQKKVKITEYMNTKKAVVEKSRTSLQNRLEELQRIRVEQVRGLTTFIFPLTGIQQNEGMDSALSMDGAEENPSSMNVIEEELAEARRLSFVHGRWIYDQREGPDVIRISISSNRVSAPVDGNYSSCEIWLKSLRVNASSEANKEMETSINRQPEIHKSNGASIYAALCLSTHLMNTIRNILSLHMPYKLHFRLFSNPHMTVQEFLMNVHKLNGNVLAFCLGYGVDPQLINPHNTLSNIQNGVQVFLHNGGRSFSCPLEPKLVQSFEEALDDSSDPIPDDEEDRLKESLSEWELSLHEEDWESLLPLPSAPAQNQYASAAPFTSQVQEDMGCSQSLVSSAVGWLTKGWWNR